MDFTNQQKIRKRSSQEDENENRGSPGIEQDTEKENNPIFQQFGNYMINKQK